VTIRRSTPPGLAVASAYASSAPRTAPMAAVTADSRMLRPNAARMYASPSAVRLDIVKPPSPVNAPMTTTRVGTTRKIATYAKNGVVPTRLRARARPAPRRPRLPGTGAGVSTTSAIVS
jgi:hypothetical protein